MTQYNETRREFLRKSAVGASALALGATGGARAGESKDEVVLGWIGAGGRGTRLLRHTLTKVGGVRVGAICDLKTDRVARARRTAEQAGHKPKGYTDLHEMIEKEKLDGIVVATEVGNHAKTVIPVLEAGIHCLSEKPMEATVEKVDRIVKAARKAKCLYQVGFQRRYNPGFIEAMRRIHSGEFGKIVYMQGHWHFTGGINTGGGWVRDVEMSGGKLVEQACHHMDVFTWVMGNKPPVECVAMAAITVEHKNPPRVIAEDHSGLCFRFPGDVILAYTHVMNCPEVWTGEKLWVYGTRWGVDLSKGLYHESNKKPESIAGESDYYMGTVEEIQGFADNIRTGAKARPNSNVETARVATLMAIMGRKAFRNTAKGPRNFESRVIKWKDLGTTTDI